MKKSAVTFLLTLMLLSHLLVVPRCEAACAKVSMVILQPLTVERTAFDAKMGISNGIPDQALQDIRVEVIIKDSEGNVKTNLFFIQPPIMTSINGTLDGGASIPAATSGEAHWLIIPSAGAGGQSPTGSDYWVGATLSYTIGNTSESIPINPAKITVKPMPQLVLDYFMPYQVIGDNPFTLLVEPPVPYPLAVRVMNDGFGPAANLRIDSAQPKITANTQGLLIDFKILGAKVNDSPVSPSLTLNFGELANKKAATASWQMISTLSGKFKEFKTSFTHASELGGDLTSLIKATTPHYLTHIVKVNLPGRDSRLDFLAYDTNLTDNVDQLPQYILESEIPDGSTDLAKSQSPVTVVFPLDVPNRPTPQTPDVPLTLASGATGWVYSKMDDPSQGLLKLLDVVRSDGVHLDPNNFWIDQGLDADYKKTWTLQFIDYRADASAPGNYTLKYVTPDLDATPPTTTLIFDGPASGTNPAFITPLTRLVLTAADNAGGSGVAGMFRKLLGTDTDFVPAYPLNLTTPGTYTMQYYSVDLAGNRETAKSASFVVVGAAPVVSSFTATPNSFSPQAPRGIAAARALHFNLNAASGVANLPVEIAISSGATFQATQVVRNLKGVATAGTPYAIAWDGKDGSGKFLPVGNYTAQLKVTDGLDNPADPTAPVHSSIAVTTLTIDDWFKATPVDPNPAADQLHPRISGTKAVWQDQRNGRWDIYLKDLVAGTSRLIPGAGADREHPAIDGNVIVWQDNRSGNWDIYGYDLSTSTELSIATAPGDQIQPVIAGDWIAWQDNRGGNWDIYAYKISTQETVRITNHERDQVHPSISGTTVAWEDYRHGLGEIYRYDLVTRAETQASFGSVDETVPAVSGSNLVWSDRRNGQSDISKSDPARGALRLTYGAGDHTQPALLDDLLVFTDFEAGTDDPNLSFRILSGGTGERLVSDPARQEESAIGASQGQSLVIWQDTRDGKYQIYSASLTTETYPIEALIKPGFNLVAVGDALATQYASASALLGSTTLGFGIERLLLHDPLHNTFTEASASGGDFILTKGAALVVYGRNSGTLKLAGSGETASYTLLPGVNQIGILTVPTGYGAYDLMNSLGLDNIQSVRRFDTITGAWQTVTVRRAAGAANSLAGANFAIQPGDGVVLTMKNRVDGWQP
jgi:beta propeller repeat protein